EESRPLFSRTGERQPDRAAGTLVFRTIRVTGDAPDRFAQRRRRIPIRAGCRILWSGSGGQFVVRSRAQVWSRAFVAIASNGRHALLRVVEERNHGDWLRVSWRGSALRGGIARVCARGTLVPGALEGRGRGVHAASLRPAIPGRLAPGIGRRDI